MNDETKVQFQVIPYSNGLDRIEVFWVDYEPSRGSVTITCWGSAWTAYFGAMNGRTIREFFAGCGADYLGTKLGITQWLKQTKQHEKYLHRIIGAIHAAIALETPDA